MPNKRSSVLLRLFFRKTLQYFLQGLAVLAPIGITLWVVLSLFNFVDDILPNIIHAIFPNWLQEDSSGSLKKIPGLGFIVVISMVLIVGRVSSSFVFGKIVDAFDNILEHTPGIKFIYSSVKDFFEAFAGNKKKFDKPVLVNVDGADVWRAGFITRESSLEFDLQDHLVVYVPHSYAISGITYLVPKHKVKILDKITAADTMKFAVSGGVSELGE